MLDSTSVLHIDGSQYGGGVGAWDGVIPLLQWHFVMPGDILVVMILNILQYPG